LSNFNVTLSGSRTFDESTPTESNLQEASVRSFSGAAVPGGTFFRPLPHLTARSFSAQSERSTWRIPH
jgi:hypothetical protein